MRWVATVFVVVLAVVIIGVIAFVVIFFDAVQTKDGDEIATRRVAATADAIMEDLGYQRDASDAETIAAERFGAYSNEVTPVAWSGSTRQGGEAVIDVRIRAVVEAQSATSVFGASNTEGSAERCYRFRLVIYEYPERTDVDCDSLPGQVDPPVATAPPELPDDAEDRGRAVLDDADADELAMRVHAAFPDLGISVDTTITDTGESVVAVGVADSKDCIVLVRAADGSVFRASFDRIQLEPGEGGCRVELYTAPAL